MDREQKIKLLKMIEAGELLPEDIEERKITLYWHVPGSEPKQYRLDSGEIVSRDELELICAERDARNVRRSAAGLDTDKAIFIEYVSAKGSDMTDYDET
jgi:hypothetical protein